MTIEGLQRQHVARLEARIEKIDRFLKEQDARLAKLFSRRSRRT